MNTSASVNADIGINLQAREQGDSVPLIPAQRLTVSYLASRGGLSTRLRAAAWRILGPLDVGLLQTCIGLTVDRHESLRTRILLDGNPRQKIDSKQPYYLDKVDFSALSLSRAEEETGRAAQLFLDEKVDLSIGPLFSARLFKLSDSDNVLVMAADHVISDGVSYEILKAEIWTLYQQAVVGEQFSLAKLTVQFGDYAVWLQRTHCRWLNEHAHYWRKRFIGAPLICQAWDDDLTESDIHSRAILHIPFGKRLSEALRALSLQQKTSLPLVVLAVYIVAMSRFLQQNELVVIFIVHGRDNYPELQNMIGFLAYPLFLRIEMTHTDTFIDVLKKTSLELSTALEHRDHGRLWDLLPTRLVLPVFNWPSRRWGQTFDGKKNETSQLRLQPFRTRFSESLVFHPFFSDTVAGISVTIHFRSSTFTRETVDAFGQDLRSLATKFVADPNSII